MTQVSFSDFRTAVLAEFPELDGELEGDDDIPYVQVGAFAAFTQHAKGQAAWDTYERCVAIVDNLLRSAEPNLRNALHVSYLEHLDFDGPRGAKAWELLSPRVQRAWQEIAASNQRLHSAPDKQAE